MIPDLIAHVHGRLRRETFQTLGLLPVMPRRLDFLTGKGPPIVHVGRGSDLPDAVQRSDTQG